VNPAVVSEEVQEENKELAPFVQAEKPVQKVADDDEDLAKIAYFATPQLLDCFLHPVDAVFAASDYNYALVKHSNELFAWGRGDNYVLGTRDDENCFKPELVNPKMFHDNFVVMVGTGSNHVVVLSTDSPDKKEELGLVDEVKNYVAPAT